MEGKRREIGQGIKRVIQSRGIELQKVAAMVGMSKQNLNYVLNVKEDRLWEKYEVRWWCNKLRVSEKMREELESKCGEGV